MLSLSAIHLSFSAALILSFAGILLDAKSVIVDDSDTKNIDYSSGWNIGNNCPKCFAQPTESQAFNGTWHDGTASGSTNLSFTFTFTGTSVEARHIAMDIINTTITFTTGTNVSYSIDGVRRGTFVRDPGDLNAYVYNQSLFSVEGLINVEHTLRVDLLKPSVLLLDYLIYDDGSAVTSPSTTPNNPSPTPSTNIGAIIGGVVAGVLVVILCGTLVWYLKNRKQGTSRRARHSMLSEDDAPPPPLLLPPGAQLAGTTKASEHSKPQQPASDRTTIHTSSMMRPNPSGESLRGTNLVATIPQRSLAITNPSSPPSVPEAYQPPNVNEKSPAGIPRQLAQATTRRGVPPSSFYTSSVANLTQAQIPDEPVEEGLMSRQASMRTTLPPYSPGGFQDDEDAPPLPER